MRKVVMALMCLACLAVSAMAAPQLEAKPSPIEMGTLKQGERVQKKLTLRNTGDADLFISQIRPSCTECFIEKFKETTLKPKEEMSVPVTYEATALPGEHSAHLTIHTNIGDDPLKRVHLNVKIVAKDAAPKIEVEPARLDLAIVPLGRPVRREIKVRNVGAAPLAFEEIAASPSLTLEGKPREPIAPKGEATLKITLNARETGILQAHISMLSNDPEHKVTTIPVRGYVATAAEIEAAAGGVLVAPEYEKGKLRAVRVRNAAGVRIGARAGLSGKEPSEIRDVEPQGSLLIPVPDDAAPDQPAPIFLLIPNRETPATDAPPPAERR